tara:strand:- start:23375 stop:24532 length:1158 start_codon:yes stop_codon:yes gene_type:complete
VKLKVPDSKRLKSVEELCLIKEPYLPLNETEELFRNAMIENIKWHREKSPYYSSLCKERNFEEDNFKNLEDIPYILANFFKRHEIKSASDNEIGLHLTSSGTSGQKSQMFFDDWTISSAQQMVGNIFDYYGWRSDEKVNYLLFTYEPEEGSKLGTAYTDNFLCEFAPVNSVHYALRYTKSGHKFDVFGCIEALKRFEEEGLPVRIFGFPAFMNFTIAQMKELGIPPLKLNKESMTFFGGGWKGHQEKAISKKEFYSELEEMLGIPDRNLRDGFGSVEHCVPYVECENHEFHIPTYSRILIRDVKTLKPLKEGQVGYLNFISPYITSVPANSVLMGDLATIHSVSECGCNLKTPFFRIVGRAGLSKNKSCAIAASEILKEFAGGEK